jgi:polysaccharide biosynthesis transport protein
MIPLGQNTLEIQRNLWLLRIHKWWIIVSFIVGTSIALIYSRSLPPLYRSSIMILVEPQRIPITYVTSTVTSTVQERLSTISQQILSRTNLEKIIAQYNLYQIHGQNRNYVTPFEKIARQVRDLTDIDITDVVGQFGLFDYRKQPPLEILVEHMRKDIEIKVIGSNNAFTVSYIGNDPTIVMNVTNTLAALFIEENLKIREQQAKGTSAFLASEYMEAKWDLEKQEMVLKKFKEQHMGALPEQMDSNLRTLDRLQVELQTINDAIKNTEDRKIFYQGQLGDFEKQLLAVKSGIISDTSEVSLASRLEHLKEELRRLQAEFNETYPDILLLKKQIRDLEEQLIQGNPTATSAKPAGSTGLQLVGAPLLAQIQTTKTQLQAINSDIESLRSRQRRILTLIKDYEKRVEETFGNEQKLLDLTRDYEMSQKVYQDLLQKRLAAKMSENLEKRQKAEQFHILDPAKVPEKPFKPDRSKIVLLGSLLSVGLGIGGILLREYLKPTYRQSEDFHGTVNLPVLVSIPRNKIKQKKGGLPITLQEPDSLITEQYRLLYTRISQMSTEKSRSIFAISSSVEDEGKTVTALNLAVVAARDFGKKTLLIEGDFKKPALSKYLQLKLQSTLLDVLLNKADLESAILSFGHENLSVLPLFSSTKNSSKLLNSLEMETLLMLLKERYDLIFVDSPPILSLPDMHILGKLIDGILLVVRCDRTARDLVVMAIDSLTTDKLVGVILNDVKQTITKHYHYLYHGD